MNISLFFETVDDLNSKQLHIDKIHQTVVTVRSTFSYCGKSFSVTDKSSIVTVMQVFANSRPKQTLVSSSSSSYNEIFSRADSSSSAIYLLDPNTYYVWLSAETDNKQNQLWVYIMSFY